jgi:release factor H-coupled RctB family protein
MSEGYIYPHLVGSDIGCGMGLWQTSLKVNRAKPLKIAEKLNGLDQAEENTGWLERYGISETIHDVTLGTPGRGNHFCEVQKIHQVVDEEAFSKLGLAEDYLTVLVHSGSRGLGESILRDVTSVSGSKPLQADTQEAIQYMRRHDEAVIWSKANRDLCAHRMANMLSCDIVNALDICHNSVTEKQVGGCQCWIHRKGAAPSDKGPVVIPGSRGDLSYLVNTVENRDDALWSIAHGAGRKIARQEARGKLKGLYFREELSTTRFGGKIICGDELLMWEEAPECYKDIDQVIKDLVSFGLVTVIASFEPLVTFKTSEGVKQERGAFKEDWKYERKEARKNKQNRQWGQS